MSDGQSEIQRIRTLIENGETREAVAQLVELVRHGHRDVYHEAILHSRRLAENERRERQGRLTSEAASAELQRVAHAVLELLDLIERSPLPQGRRTAAVANEMTALTTAPPFDVSPAPDEQQAGDHGAADVFISHASEDKESVARPLAELLTQRGCTVWYDTFRLRLGDSLHAEIDRGLSGCRFGVVILSPSFFSKPWPMRELSALLALETADGRKRVLPVWHQMDSAAIAAKSALLSDRLGVSTTAGLEEVARRIVEALHPRE